jgi:hypothetical protein
MQQDFFHLVWLTAGMLAILVLPILIGVLAVLADRD